MTLLRVGLVLAAAVAAAVVANVVLLGVATGSGGPGRLSPHAVLIAPKPPTAHVKPAPAPPVRRGEREHGDDCLQPFTRSSRIVALAWPALNQARHRTEAS